MVAPSARRTSRAMASGGGPPLVGGGGCDGSRRPGSVPPEGAGGGTHAAAEDRRGGVEVAPAVREADVLDGFIGAVTRSLRWRAKSLLRLSSVEDALVGR